MNASFQCNVDSALMEKFNIALALNKTTADIVIEELIRKYVSDSFTKASKAYRKPTQVPRKASNEATVDTCIAIGRIPQWARKPNQINHKIIRAFFRLEAELGHVPLRELEKRCLDNAMHSDVYIPTFKSNYVQMKIDVPRSHGKVFEERDGDVVIWDRVKDTLMEFKSYFVS